MYKIWCVIPVRSRESDSLAGSKSVKLLAKRGWPPPILVGFKQIKIYKMKKVLLSSMLVMAAASMNAQVVVDTVSMGAGYANNVWYSLAGDEAGSQPANNWDIALAATSSQNSSLTTAMHINIKTVKLYEATGTAVADFAAMDSFSSGWTALYNSDTSWAEGAFNTTTPMSGFDYGWGTYNTTTHNVEANRVFVLEYAGNVYRKMHVTLNSTAGTYTLVHANLDNTDLHTETLNTATYGTKNFMYFNLTTNAIVDREPETTDWDLLFTQYSAYIPGPYTVTGIIGNVDVEILKVTNIANVNTYTNWISPDYSPYINTIGYNWKAFVNNVYAIEDSTVYFVKAMDGDIWKVIMTGFGGSANGSSMFSKEKMVTASVENAAGKNAASLTVFPNPSNGNNVTVIYSLGNDSKTSKVMVTDMTGRVVLVNELNKQKGLYEYKLPSLNLAAGTYIINVLTDAGAMQQKFVIQ
jgi:hypothetical protein